MSKDLSDPRRPREPRAAQQTLYGPGYFDRQLHHHHWFHNNAAKRDLRWREVLRMLEPGEQDRVLELGCATGEHSLRLAPFVREIVGVDSADAAIDRARERAESLGVHNASFLKLDATNLRGLPDATFDKVAAVDFVEHVDDASLLSVLRESRRVLRTEGRLAIFTPCASHYVERLKSRNILLQQTYGHIAVRGEDQYRTLLLQGGFEVISLYFSPSTYPMAGRLDRWLWNVRSIGQWFRFRICIVAKPATTGTTR
ncbi:MAG: class I SAM-dependent methyltransferase [Terriglobia bacterium]